MIEFKFFLSTLQDTIVIKNDDFIGKGAYGKVYYIGEMYGTKSVMKISESTKKSNEYFFEKHYYNTHNSDFGIPKFISHGSALNLINSKVYDYMIIEYVGYYSLNKIIRHISNSYDEEEKEIFKILHKSLYFQLKKIHDSGIILRDIKSENIVLNDVIGYYFAKKYYSLANELNETTYNICKCETSFAEIKRLFEEKKYDSLVKFVDFGIAFDINELHKNAYYNKNGNFTLGTFDGLCGLDELFASTLTHISPFSLINLSDMLNFRQSEDSMITSKENISMLLELADIWSLNILFSICLFDIMHKQRYCEKIKKYKKIYNGNLYFLPIVINRNNNFDLKKELLFDEIVFDDEIEIIQNCISCILKKILFLANNIKERDNFNSKSTIIKKNYTENYVYKLNDIIAETYNDIILFIDNIILS